MTRAYNTATTQQNSGGAVSPFIAGKNKIINGDFGVNQRNFTSVTSTSLFTFDRFLVLSGGTTTTYDFTPQTFTPGTAPVAGYEGKNFLRCAITTSTSAYIVVGQRIEDVRTFAGQTMTVSFWAKAASGTPAVDVVSVQEYGTGGSTSTQVVSTKQNISTSWARYSFTITNGSISGKTIGTNSNLFVYIALSDALIGTGVGDQTGTFDIWGLQVEAGSVATAFQTATGTIQGELAACQRYYYRTNVTGSGNAAYISVGFSTTTTNAFLLINNPVPMRVPAASTDFSAICLTDPGTADFAITALTLQAARCTGLVTSIAATVASGLSATRVYYSATTSAAGYIGVNAEL